MDKKSNGLEAVLEVSEEAILSILNDEGIITLKDFARKYSTAVDAALRENPKLAEMIFMQMGNDKFKGYITEKQEDNKISIEHKVPQMKLEIDGTSYKPEEIKLFNGKKLHFVVNNKTDAQGIMIGFSTQDNLKEYLKSKKVRYSDNTDAMIDTNQSMKYRVPSVGKAYEHINFRGKVLILPTLNNRYRYADLRNYYRDSFLWWYWNDWNDVISSIKVFDFWVVFHEHIHYGGDDFMMEPRTEIRNLVSYGWNDKISSIAVVMGD